MKNLPVKAMIAIFSVLCMVLIGTSVQAETIDENDMVIKKRCRDDEEVGMVNVVTGAGIYKDFLFIEYELDDDSSWEIHGTYLAAEEDLDDIPTNWCGFPKIKKFEYNEKSDYFWDDSDSKKYAQAPSDSKIVYKIPLEEKNDHDWDEDDTLYISAYSILKKTVTFNFWGRSREITIYRSCWTSTGTNFSNWGNSNYYTVDL